MSGTYHSASYSLLSFLLQNDHEIIALTNVAAEESRAAASRSALIGELEPLAHLKNEYEGRNDQDVVMRKLSWLESQGYNQMRRVRGDGECFYRAFLYTALERLHLERNKDEHEGLRSTAQATIDSFDSVGFQKLVTEDFVDAFMDLLNKSLTTTAQDLLDAFQNAETSNATVVFARLAASSYIRAHGMAFEPFLELGPGQDLISWVSQDVEAMGKDADQPAIIALVLALGIPVRIAYLDRSDGGGGASEEESSGQRVQKIDWHEMDPEDLNLMMGEEGKTRKAFKKPITLLYQPGHYTILYPTAAHAN